MRKVDKFNIETLFEKASNSSRKRAHLNLHTSFEDKVQRLYIALIKGSYVEPHFHEQEHQWEMFVVQSGVLKVTLHNPDSSSITSFFIGDEQDVHAVEFNPGDIHSVECISDRALILEIKEGPFIEEQAKTLLKL